MPRGFTSKKTCEKCDQSFSLFGFKRHYDSCFGQKSRKPRIAWNRGLTKETSESVRVQGESYTKSQTGKPGRKHSDETRKKLSAIRKKYLEENPRKVPYVLNHSSKISYPEQYFLECFSELAFQHPIFRYRLDFANVEEKLYLEVDGEQHYSISGMAHDLRRTEFLTNAGWVGQRVRWSHFQKLSSKEKSETIQNLRSLMKLVS